MPHTVRLVGLDGLEPSTSRLSGARSSHLSYRPVFPQVLGSLHRADFVCLPSQSLTKPWGRDSEPSTRLRRVIGVLSTIQLQQFSLCGACTVNRKLVEMKGFEPLTPCLQGRCSPNWATPPYSGLYLRTLLIESWQLNNKIHQYKSTHTHLPRFFVLIWLRVLKNVSRS